MKRALTWARLTVVFIALGVSLLADLRNTAPDPSPVVDAPDIDLCHVEPGSIARRSVTIERPLRRRVDHILTSCSCLEVAIAQSSARSESLALEVTVLVPFAAGLHSFDYVVILRGGARIHGTVRLNSVEAPSFWPRCVYVDLPRDEMDWRAEVALILPKFYDPERTTARATQGVQIVLGSPVLDGENWRISLDVRGRLESAWLQSLGLYSGKFSYPIEVNAQVDDNYSTIVSTSVHVSRSQTLAVSPRRVVTKIGNVVHLHVATSAGATFDVFCDPPGSAVVDVESSGRTVTVDTRQCRVESFAVILASGSMVTHVPFVCLEE